MKTTFRIRQPYADRFAKCAAAFVNSSPAKPTRFMEIMKTNNGMAGAGFGLVGEDGLERKNPVIVALGDSVTAGHFENLVSPESKKVVGPVFGMMAAGASKKEIRAYIESIGGLPVSEIFDARESYLEKFRAKLIDRYELTSVSVINSGIAGDTLPSMIARADRDVIRYQPDLILINGSLNWNDAQLGDENVYKELLQGLVRKLKAQTQADIILLTPNGDLPNTLFAPPGAVLPETTTGKRAEKIREVAREEQVCLADVRALWDDARAAGCPWEELLSNGINHPSVEGQEVYAQVLMQLFEEEA